MKTYFLPLVLLIFSTFLTATNSIKLTVQSMDWFLKNHTYINETLKTGEVKEIIPVVNTLGSIWLHRDGAIASEVSETIANAMIHQPVLIFNWFDKYPDQASNFANGISNNIFTDFSGTEENTNRLIKFKKVLAKSLNNFMKEERRLEIKSTVKMMYDAVTKSAVESIE